MSDEIAVAELPTEAPVEAPVSEAPVERSMDDTLKETFEAMKARRPEHGDDGKFVPKAGADPATPKVEVPGKSEGAAPELVQPAIEPPISLPADVKAKWSQLPPDIQQVWARRESEIHEKITTDGQRLKSLSAFEEVTSAVQDRLRQVNAPAPEYFRRLAAADQLLATDGIRGLQQIAQMYGIDIQAAFNGQPAQGQPDPQYNALAQELGAIKSKLTAQEKAAETAKLTEAEKKIEAFKKDRPHFDRLEPVMVKLYDPSIELEDLYKLALAHPEAREVSAAIEAEREAKAKAEALEKQKAEAAKAAKLSTLSRKPGSVGVVAKAGGSWEDSMAATFRGIRARG